MKFAAIIPARKNSKGLTNKNYKLFNKKPLIYWTIKSAIQSKCFEKIIVSTDSTKIQKISQKMGVECPVLRPKKLSGDKINVHKVVKYVMNFYKKKDSSFQPDAIVLLQPTSPLREYSDIRKCCKIFNKSKPDSLVSVLKVPHNFNPKNLYSLKNNFLISLSKKKKLLQRQQQNLFYARNGASIYITKSIKLNKYILGGKIKGYLMNNLKSIDINDKNDFSLAEIAQNKFRYNTIK